jgi:hypothetical protein
MPSKALYFSEMQRNHWYLVSSHGSILFYIAANPDCTVEDIMDGMSLTRRTVWGIIGDLRRAGMLDARRNGRLHHYNVNLDGPFLHPTIGYIPLRTIPGQMMLQGPADTTTYDTAAG